MAKTAPAPAAAPAPAPVAAEAPPPQLMPTHGGCWVRQPDGTLAPETPPADAAPKE